MHKALKAALPEARGVSTSIFAIVADIRGFSKFSLLHESPDVAMYIKRVYIRLIEEYFPFASFYKTTGDGLLMTVTFDEDDIEDRARATVDACLRCHREFPNICAGDKMINFEVPSLIGFGVTRGTACCLVSGELVLDYSGQILNLASRLTDLARPEGVILDGQFGIELLSNPVKEKFEPTEVHIRSVAEAEPRSIYILKGVVEVPAYAKMPLDFENWEQVIHEATLAEWRIRSQWEVPLPRRLRRADGFRAEVTSPKYRSGKPVPGVMTRISLKNVRYAPIAGRPIIIIDPAELVKKVRSGKTPLKTTVRLIVDFVPRVD